MKTLLSLILALALPLATNAAPPPRAGASPFQDGKFQGRIAYSADGNNRDRDDLFASAVTIAMFKALGVTDKVVHFDYNSILGEDNPEYLKVHEESVRGAAKRFGLPEKIIFNDSRELEASIKNIRDAVNASSEQDPLYFVIAGPMEVPYRGINAADPARRKHVYCISHTVWNDLFFWDASNRQLTHHRQDLIDLGINWVQILNQRGLGTCPEPKNGPCPQEKWALWDWMRDSRIDNVAWLYERLEAMGRPDCSDSGMVYFLLTGNEEATVQDLNNLLHGRVPRPLEQRPSIRLEAESFQFENYVAPSQRLGSAVSQRGAAQLDRGKQEGSIRSVFNQPYAPSGRYDIDVRYFDASEGRCELTLVVAGAQQGEPLTKTSHTGEWQTWKVSNVAVNAGDEIAVKVKADGKHTGQLDYVQFNRVANAPAAKTGADSAARAKTLRVALIQMALKPTLEENRDRIVRGIADAAERKARVAVFPEGALTGSGGERTEPVEAAVETIRRAAREKNVYVVSGAHTYLPSVKRNVNWMFAIGPGGEELLRYEKIYDNHRAKMPGVFVIDGVPANTAICADRWLRGVVELPIQQGSQIFFEISNNYACEWVEPYGWYWNAPLARRNTVWSIFCNSGNEAAGQTSPGAILKHGHSAIIAPDGRVVASTKSDSEEIVIADIDPSEATRAMTLARGSHPALRPFWEAGIKLQQGETIPAPVFKPLNSPAVDITLAAAPIVNDVERMEGAIAQAKARQADLIAFPSQAISEDSLPRLQAAAQKNAICVAVGALHRSNSGQCNSAFVIGPDGKLLTRYDQLSATVPYQPGADPRAMWFRIKDVPAVITLEQDALWTELAELPAVAGAQIHIHLDRAIDESATGQQHRLQSWVTCASFLTFSATVSDRDAMLWDDLHSREESRAEVRGTPRPDPGQVEVMSPFSANLIARAPAGELIVAKRRVSATNPYHPQRTANMNPQLKPWYELGAALIGPDK
jgi:predicted amidohydrolase